MTGKIGGRVRWWAAVFAGALLILAVLAASGRPTVFTDTDDYYALGKELVTDIGLGPPPPELSDADIRQAMIDSHMGHTQMASRSAVYGVYLYAVESAGTLWLVALTQALAVSWLVLTTWRAAFPAMRLRRAVVAIGVVAAVSPLPFFAGFAMPDVFAGVVVLAATVLAIFPDRVGRAARWGAWLLLTFALGVHTSHILFMVPLIVVAAMVLIWLRVGRRAIVMRVGGLVAALFVATAANSAYGVLVRIKTGDTLRNQPFLTARLLADGPGHAYLRHACATGTPYALCRFKDKPLSDSEDVLWSDLPKTGVFMLSDYPTRVRLEEQEARFVLGTIAFAPGAQLVASLRNWGKQLILVYVDDPVRDPVFYLTDPYWKQTNLPNLIGRIAECGKRGTACRPWLSSRDSRWWHGGMVMAALGVALVAGVRVRATTSAANRENDRRLAALVALFTAGILLNAAVCGILSGPFARYQSRVIWLVPVAAALLVAEWRRRATGGSATRTA